MLFERITYEDDFPVHINIAAITEDPLHYHVDIEFIYVLKGEIRLKNGYCHYLLREGDIFTSSGHEVHSLTAAGENIVARIQISTHYFSQYFSNLSKSCYRTYIKKQDDKKLDRLRELMLLLLLKYSVRNFHYKTECISIMVDIIRHLEKYFNLFAFDKNMVVGFDRGNQISVERISHICQYIYQYYAENITLQDLSDMEHLSTFYLSHLIKDFTGMSFRDFLCFARVEWSEILLLDSDKKISHIAKEVGFSTTAYYEKYFRKWFQHSPGEHRKLYAPLIKSDLRPPVLHIIPAAKAAAIIRSLYSGYHLKKDNGTEISSLHFETDIDTHTKPLCKFDRQLAVTLCPDDYKYLGFHLFTILTELSPDKIILQKRQDDTPGDEQALLQLLHHSHFTVEIRYRNPRVIPCSSSYDSIAWAIHLLRKYIRKQESLIEMPLRDVCTAPGEILQGQPAVLTYTGIKKPSFFTYCLLSKIKGDMIYESSYCCAVRKIKAGKPVYILLAYHFNNDIQEVCLKATDRHQVKSTLNFFKDEISISLTLSLRPGTYSVVKYSMDKDHNIFGYMASVNFRNDAAADCGFSENMSGFSSVEMYLEDVRTVLSLNFSIKGAGINIAVIHTLEDLPS